ncbi:hypothetical protein BBOV_I002480 [Babesia bovis T2Bo]|uniref:Uncharacterized protein n=1 Tax=Babesia bovis TaxID=5865 RepID=A7AWA2_BABBO|nr:hypothetical protein BBOV_I002480 [Babesia bovis T2Bo]EDO05330.1 hypothetical protein BBOV_I002480 [Babesia bovis T2Bo]|eukprot:XP_001608898.1 hypothetical protein [Babesia bovis T2Bo]
MKCCLSRFLICLLAYTVSFVNSTKNEATEDVKPPEPRFISSDNSLLGSLYGVMSLRRIRRSLNQYYCQVAPYISLGDNPPVITVYGNMKSMTGILVGYGTKEVRSMFRPNKGYVYGVGNSRGNRVKSKRNIAFSVDYAPPQQPRWNTEEFCMLVFSPALKFGPSLENLIGKRFDHENRRLGSTENISRTLIRESEGTDSKLVTQCCFLMYH